MKERNFLSNYSNRMALQKLFETEALKQSLKLLEKVLK